mmetsp:Transcript_27480/g.59791  ORF Transcript_27480/g.59791 Transcript_27480/m.59791 type:complete len:209 (+) Transcript_27480:423-1049(+)
MGSVLDRGRGCGGFFCAEVEGAGDHPGTEGTGQDSRCDPGSGGSPGGSPGCGPGPGHGSCPRSGSAGGRSPAGSAGSGSGGSAAVAACGRTAAGLCPCACCACAGAGAGSGGSECVAGLRCLFRCHIIADDPGSCGPDRDRGAARLRVDLRPQGLRQCGRGGRCYGGLVPGLGGSWPAEVTGYGRCPRSAQRAARLRSVCVFLPYLLA